MHNDTDKQCPRPAELAVAPPDRATADPCGPAPVAPAKAKTEASVRDARLKAALKANMARRKGQARARAGSGTDPSNIEKNK